MPDATPPKALIVGISGPSSSGKTTLARLLQRIFNGVAGSPGTDPLHTFIIHEDDFYYPDDQIPYTTTPSGTRIQDWDTAAAIDTTFLAQALAYVRTNGCLPPRLRSKEDQNEQTESGVPDSLIAELRAGVGRDLGGRGGPAPTIAFLEGFLLYSPLGTQTGVDTGSGSGGGSSETAVALQPVHAQIQLPLFLPASYENVKQRREARSGYVTIGPAPGPTEGDKAKTSETGDGTREIDMEGEDDRPPQNFWTDPPGYVDDIVWPRYVQDHAWLLVPRGAEGDLLSRVGDGTEVREDVGVRVAPGKGEQGMSEMVRWAVREIVDSYLAATI
ncbi:hypothetical protein N7492_005003 [Penicillium capsulatum]|uniref:Phosphoribulokinase/uridine kinase domain-containing protein n=1 Tax=Penicillium capsulatum TaxID=69766 RepID=A0A9W9I8U0_9EURO|nr:hypothetical protein N7492_005003 [Penicillium capsulatum]KAJ6135890.1 hypothetical protein N7512_001050 [Penicillium capsulatum]